MAHSPAASSGRDHGERLESGTGYVSSPAPANQSHRTRRRRNMAARRAERRGYPQSRWASETDGSASDHGSPILPGSNHHQRRLDPPTAPAGDQRICFKGARHPMSNMYRCVVQYDGRTFHSTEQAYQWRRAKDLGNQRLAGRILGARNGFAAKRLSNRLRKAARAHWRANHAINVMKELVALKFDQVPAFRRACLDSGDALLLEATFDKTWGVGLPVDAAMTSRIADMPGYNILGWIIALRRDQASRTTNTWVQQYRARSGGSASTDLPPLLQGIGCALSETSIPSDPYNDHLLFSPRASPGGRSSGNATC